MMPFIELNIPSGTRDFHPAQMKIRNEIVKNIINVYENHGCVTIDTPVFEKRELLMHKYGENEKLVYNLEDQGGQLLTMRYDLTVPFSRYVSMYNIQHIKRYQIAKVYRRDNPSMMQGRYREFTQMDVDIAGIGDSVLQDAEIIKILVDALDSTKVGNYIIKINNRQLLTTILQFCGITSEQMNTTCSSIDKLDKLEWVSIAKELEQKGILIDVIMNVKKYIQLSGPPVDILKELRLLEDKLDIINPILNDLEQLFAYLDAIGCLNKIVFCCNLARGLDYYTGIIFEAVLINTDLEVGSIAGGGRYDNLIENFHPQKKHIPSVGFSIGIERIFAILESKLNVSKIEKYTSTDTQILVCSVKNNTKLLYPYLLKICSILWNHNIKTEFMYDTKPTMKQQIEYALDNNIPFMIIVGDNELANKMCVIKNITTRQQISIPFDEIVNYLLEIMKK